MSAPTIALLTDFGLEDFFVPSLKGVILGINPQARIVDVSHSVPSYDVRAGGFLLAACAPFFPAGTIFLSVVDPGVGSERRILLARTGRHDFIAPDNGLLTLSLEGASGLELRSVSSAKFFLSRTGRTFEGRDKMAPAAAWLSLGTPASELGPLQDGYVKHEVLRARVESGRIRGEVAYVDKFGNLITNIPVALLASLEPGPSASFTFGLKGGTASVYLDSYSRARPGQLFALPGSLGTIEIALRRDSAAARLGARAGDEVSVAPR
jgi:S-adenosylmethionine hydrolase